MFKPLRIAAAIFLDGHVPLPGFPRVHEAHMSLESLQVEKWQRVSTLITGDSAVHFSCVVRFDKLG